MKIWIFLTLVAVLYSCSSEKAEDKKSSTSGQEGEATQQQQEQPAQCLEGKIERLLPDARTAIVTLADDPEVWHFWDIRSNRVKKSISKLFNISQINRDGEYAMRNFGDVRFQFQKLDDGVSAYREILLFSRGSEPKLEFSLDGQFVSIFYKKGAFSPNRSLIFDLENRDLHWSAQFSDIRGMKAKDDLFGAVVTFHNSRYALHAFDLKENKIIFQTSTADRFQSIHLTENNLLVQSEDRITVYDQLNPTVLYQISDVRVISVDSELDYALLQDSAGAYFVIDTITGATLYELGASLSLSGCVMAMENYAIYCIDSSRLTSIKRFNLNHQKTESYCLQSR